MTKYIKTTSVTITMVQHMIEKKTRSKEKLSCYLIWAYLFSCMQMFECKIIFNTIDSQICIFLRIAKRTIDTPLNFIYRNVTKPHCTVSRKLMHCAIAYNT